MDATSEPAFATWLDGNISSISDHIKDLEREERAAVTSWLYGKIFDEACNRARELELLDVLAILRNEPERSTGLGNKESIKYLKHARHVLAEARDWLLDKQSGYLTPKICEALDISPKTLGRYCDDAKVKRAGVGERDFRFKPASVRKLCRWVIRNGPTHKSVQHAEKLLAEIDS